MQGLGGISLEEVCFSEWADISRPSQAQYVSACCLWIERSSQQLLPSMMIMDEPSETVSTPPPPVKYFYKG